MFIRYFPPFFYSFLCYCIFSHSLHYLFLSHNSHHHHCTHSPLFNSPVTGNCRRSPFYLSSRKTTAKNRSEIIEAKQCSGRREKDATASEMKVVVGGDGKEEVAMDYVRSERWLHLLLFVGIISGAVSHRWW